eukprot:PhF_6_TR40/c0_g1_i1/m.53
MKELTKDWNCKPASWQTNSEIDDVKCNGKNRITNFAWIGKFCTSTNPLNVSNMPSKLTGLYLTNNQFSGTLQFNHLPSTLTMLELNVNQFNGTVQLSHLP